MVSLSHSLSLSRSLSLPVFFRLFRSLSFSLSLLFARARARALSSSFFRSLFPLGNYPKKTNGAGIGGGEAGRDQIRHTSSVNLKQFIVSRYHFLILRGCESFLTVRNEREKKRERERKKRQSEEKREQERDRERGRDSKKGNENE